MIIGSKRKNEFAKAKLPIKYNATVFSTLAKR